MRVADSPGGARGPCCSLSITAGRRMVAIVAAPGHARDNGGGIAPVAHCDPYLPAFTRSPRARRIPIRSAQHLVESSAAREGGAIRSLPRRRPLPRGDRFPEDRGGGERSRAAPALIAEGDAFFRRAVATRRPSADARDWQNLEALAAAQGRDRYALRRPPARARLATTRVAGRGAINPSRAGWGHPVAQRAAHERSRARSERCAAS